MSSVEDVEVSTGPEVRFGDVVSGFLKGLRGGEDRNPKVVSAG